MTDARLLGEHYGQHGLALIAQPSNQFKQQEPLSGQALAAWMRSRKWPGEVLDKANVNGRGATPLFDFLKVASGNTDKIPWVRQGEGAAAGERGRQRLRPRARTHARSPPLLTPPPQPNPTLARALEELYQIHRRPRGQGARPLCAAQAPCRPGAPAAPAARAGPARA